VLRTGQIGAPAVTRLRSAPPSCASPLLSVGS